MFKRTVTVELLDNYPVINMKMEANVKSIDMQYAYMEIERNLNNFMDTVFIVVDLTQNERLPVQATIAGALFGPYLNPKIEQWLVVGEHRVGQQIAKQLSFWTGKEHVEWFACYEDCLTYVQQEIRHTAKIG